MQRQYILTPTTNSLLDELLNGMEIVRAGRSNGQKVVLVWPHS
jgi:hypothetical protein